jgi:alkylated DNA repair protein (DNA oxidative demethylase)
VKPIDVGTGVKLWPGRLSAIEQQDLLAAVMQRVGAAPFYRPTMPKTGKEFSVQMTNFGPLGWVSDAAGGYRYQAHHPISGDAWPDIPDALLSLWSDTTHYGAPPEACLVNLYRNSARMGVHRDADEPAVDAPVLSVSLGDSAVFRFGPGAERRGTRTLKLNTGDVLMFGGASRLMYHGIDRILAGSSALVEERGRDQLDPKTRQPKG